MPQKKTVKRTKVKKPALKRQIQNSALSLAATVEKEFRQIPAKLAKLYRQELQAQKNQEAKWKKELSQAEATRKAAQNKQAALLSAKVTPSSKKQLAAAKKSNEQAAKTIKMLTSQWDRMTKQNDMLRAKQNKYTLLNKELAKLEKELTLKAAASIKAKKPVMKKSKVKPPKMTKSKKHMADEPTTTETPFTTSPSTEPVEM